MQSLKEARVIQPIRGEALQRTLRREFEPGLTVHQGACVTNVQMILIMGQSSHLGNVELSWATKRYDGNLKQ